MGIRTYTSDRTQAWTFNNDADTDLASDDTPLTLEDLTPEDITDLFVLSSEEVKNVHQSAPKGKPSSKSAYADPANYKWPIDEKHIRAAVSYYNHGNKSGYSDSQWATIGRKIAAAANRLIGPGHKYANGKIQTAETADEEFVVLPLSPEDLTVSTEEIAVNGVPCYQIEAMVVPGDAVSRNTVPGKKGPTYYSNRRVRQYATDNNRIVEELAAKGQRVTVYPRHAAALLDASLPMGWVDGYEVRPSKRGHGLEDLWYRATIPLTTEGRDAMMKLRTGLIKYSSLRTFSDGQFKTEPVRMNGQTVEEATALPIAGIDLVATQPGLPVDPIRILEEAADLEPATEDSMSAPVQQQAPQRQPAPAQQNPPQQQQQQAPQTSGAQVPPQYATCPSCGADLTHHIQAAHAAMSASSQQQQPPQQQQGAPQQQGQQPPQRSAREEELETQVTVLAEALSTATAELEAQKSMTDEVKQPSAVEGDGELAGKYEAALAKITALESERDATKAALEEVQTFVAAAKAAQALTAKVNELVAADATLGAHMRGIITAAIEEQQLSDPIAVEIAYYKLRSAETEKRAFASPSRSAIPGFGHTNLTGVEERAGVSAAASAGRSSTDATDAAKDKQLTPAAAQMRNVFSRTGVGNKKSRWDA